MGGQLWQQPEVLSGPSLPFSFCSLSWKGRQSISPHAVLSREIAESSQFPSDGLKGIYKPFRFLSIPSFPARLARMPTHLMHCDHQTTCRVPVFWVKTRFILPASYFKEPTHSVTQHEGSHGHPQGFLYSYRRSNWQYLSAINVCLPPLCEFTVQQRTLAALQGEGSSYFSKGKHLSNMPNETTP